MRTQWENWEEIFWVNEETWSIFYLIFSLLLLKITSQNDLILSLRSKFLKFRIQMNFFFFVIQFLHAKWELKDDRKLYKEDDDDEK